MGDAALGMQQVSRGLWLGGNVSGRRGDDDACVTSAPGLTPTGRLDSMMLVGWLPSTLDPGTKIKREAAAPGQAR